MGLPVPAPGSRLKQTHTPLLLGPCPRIISRTSGAPSWLWSHLGSSFSILTLGTSRPDVSTALCQAWLPHTCWSSQVQPRAQPRCKSISLDSCFPESHRACPEHKALPIPQKEASTGQIMRGDTDCHSQRAEPEGPEDHNAMQLQPCRPVVCKEVPLHPPATAPLALL